MTKFFVTPFSENGDMAIIPDGAQSDGVVSYEAGFTPDYELDPLDSNSKPVPRDGFNRLFHDITQAIGDVQITGFPQWAADVGTLAGGYPKHAIVWFGGDTWQSQLDDNTETPGPDAIGWLPSAKYQGGGAGSGDFGLIGPTTITVGGTFTYTISPYSSFLTYTVSATHGTPSVSGQTVTLVIASGETSQVTDLTVNRSDGKSQDFRIAIGAQSISKPSLLSPANGATDVPLGPTLVASAFATYPTGADTHVSTDWRARNSGGTVLWQSNANTVNKTTIGIPDNTLPLNTLVTFDCRYRGATLPVSPWSDPVTVTTTNQSISTPSITSPLNGATGIGRTPTFTATAFATNPLGADTHKSSDWQLKNGSGVVVWSSINDTVNKTQLTLPSGVLTTSANWTIEVRYNGNILQPSQWSPVVGFTTAASFEFGKYLAYAQATTPFIGVYGQDIDTLNKLANPTPAPTKATQSVAFSYLGNYLALAGQATEPLFIYKRSGDSFAKIANPAIMPPDLSFDCAFSPDETYLAVGSNSAPYISIYKRSGDVFTKLANPANLPTSQVYGVSFSADGNYLAVTGSSTGLELIIYKRSGDTFTKLANPATMPTGTSYGPTFSPDGVYLAIAHNTSPFVTIYKRSGDTFTKLANPATLPPGNSNDAAFSPDGVHLAVTSGLAPAVTIYKRSGDTFTKLANPSAVPGSSISVAFSGDGNYMSVGMSVAPYLFTYKRSGDTFSKLADPATMPTGNAKVAYYPPVLGV